MLIPVVPGYSINSAVVLLCGPNKDILSILMDNMISFCRYTSLFMISSKGNFFHVV